MKRSDPTRALLLVLAAAAAVALVYVGARPTQARVIHEAESPYGRIRVVERRDGLRSLYTGAGRARQSAVFPARPLHLEVAYTRIGTIGLALIPDSARILYVGLGGGAMPMHARHIRADATIDVVEIDPAIVATAVRFFGFEVDGRLRVHTGDGREFVEAADPGSYHLVVLDAFSDDEIPSHLATREFLEAVHASLAADGFVVANLWGSQRAYASMLATYESVFPTVRRVRVPGGSQRIVVAGTEGPPLDRETLVAAATRLGRRAPLGFDLAELIQSGYEMQPAAAAPVLRDPPEGP